MKAALTRSFRLVVPFALICLSALKAEAQASGHQRIGVERSADWELAFELSGGMSAAELDAVDLFFFDSAASVDLTVAQRWLASINLPFFARSAIGDGVGPASAAGLGDLGLSLGWTRRFADARITTSLNLTAPSGYWSEHPDEEERLISGSGRWFLGGQLSASTILDPVVLSAAFAYEIGFPRTEAGLSTWRPGDMSLSLGFTEVLNDRVGYSLKLVQSASLPEAGGATSLDSFSYQASAFFELWYSHGDITLRYGVSKSVSGLEGPARLSAALSYALRPKERMPVGVE